MKRGQRGKASPEELNFKHPVHSSRHKSALVLLIISIVLFLMWDAQRAHKSRPSLILEGARAEPQQQALISPTILKQTPFVGGGGKTPEPVMTQQLSSRQMEKKIVDGILGEFYYDKRIRPPGSGALNTSKPGE